MSVDLAITPRIESSLNVVRDQEGNTSDLYLATQDTAVGTATPSPETALTVAAPAGSTALATVRPDEQRRWHWKAVAGDTTVFTIRTQNGAFQIWVGGTQRLTIDASGNIELDSSGGSLFLKGLSQLSGPDVVDLVVNTSNGQVGHQ